MDYQRAQNIRGKSFASMMADKLTSGQGIGSSIASTVSERSKARMTGMKQRFDPMNIAKFMTGGSTLGPALVGKLTGRSKRDIQFFTGKGKRTDTASKIGSLEKGNDFLTSLMSIQELLVKSQEEDKKLKEQENNYKEEVMAEKERRHKELIAAIKGKPVEAAANTPTATKVETPSPLDDILGIAGAAASLLSILKFFTGGLGLALLTGVGLSAALLMLLGRDKNPEQTNKMIQGAMGGPAMEAQAITDAVNNTTEIERRKQNILAARPASKKSYLFWKDGDLQQQYLAEIGWDNNTGLTKSEKDQGFTAIDEKGIPVKKEQNKAVVPASAEQTTAPATATETGTAPTSTPVSQTPTVTPMESIPAVNQVFNTVQKENLDVNIPQSKADPATIVNNSVTRTAKADVGRLPMPSVRNMDDTFQRMLVGSTRVV